MNCMLNVLGYITLSSPLLSLYIQHEKKIILFIIVMFFPVEKNIASIILIIMYNTPCMHQHVYSVSDSLR